MNKSHTRSLPTNVASLDSDQLARLLTLLRCFGADESELENLAETGIELGEDLLRQVGISDHGFLFVGLNSGACRHQCQRAFWFPNKTASVANTVFVASARLGQNLEDRAEWFDAIRTLAFKMQLDGRAFLTSRRTTSHAYTKRLAELLDLDLVELKSFPPNVSQAWVNEALKTERQLFSLDLATVQLKTSAQTRAIRPPSIDFTLSSIANEVFALATRSNGNTFNSIKNRLLTNPDLRTYLLADRRLNSRSVSNELKDLGATPWYLFRNADPKLEESAVNSPSNVRSLAEVDCSQYLLHWTRRCVGAWPDQSETAHLDDLLFQANRADHQPIRALSRILATQRLYGSSNITRDNRAVTCFSEVQLDQLLEHRTFRQHLARWDFEPFGVAVQKESLQNSGIRPVIYGEETDWNSLSQSDKPFFQKSASTSGTIDWTKEKEWRILGDLDLRQFDASQLLVFVPDYEAAMAVAPLSRWPIVMLNNDDAYAAKP